MSNKFTTIVENLYEHYIILYISHVTNQQRFDIPVETIWKTRRWNYDCLQNWNLWKDNDLLWNGLEIWDVTISMEHFWTLVTAHQLSPIHAHCTPVLIGIILLCLPSILSMFWKTNYIKFHMLNADMVKAVSNHWSQFHMQISYCSLTSHIQTCSYKCTIQIFICHMLTVRNFWCGTGLAFVTAVNACL